MDELAPLSVSAGAAARRIAVISMHTSPTATLGHSANGGLNVYVRRICERLSECGIATDVYTRAGDRADARRMWIAPLSRVIRLAAGSPDLSKTDLAVAAAPFGRAIAQRARAEGLEYDLVYSHYWLSGLAAEALRDELGVPWVHTAHTLAVVKNRRLARGAVPESAVRMAAEKRIAESADLCVASTEFEREDLIHALGARPDRVRVVPPGVDLETFHPVSAAHARRRVGAGDGPLVLFAGRLERLKGVEIVLRAFAAVASRLPDRKMRLVVAGEDSRDAAESEKARLRRIAADLGIGGSVDFVGPVEHRRLRQYYSAADVCMMPSYSESFGLVALEAQACGCPVIGSDVSGLASVVRDGVTGYLVGGDDPEAYAERLLKLIQEPDLARQMGRRGILLAQRFSWDRTRDALIGEFERLAGDQERVQAIARHE